MGNGNLLDYILTLEIFKIDTNLNVFTHLLFSVIGVSIIEFSVISYFEHFIKIEWWVLFFSPLITNYILSFRIPK